LGGEGRGHWEGEGKGKGEGREGNRREDRKGESVPANKKLQLHHWYYARYPYCRNPDIKADVQYVTITVTIRRPFRCCIISPAGPGRAARRRRKSCNTTHGRLGFCSRRSTAVILCIRNATVSRGTPRPAAAATACEDGME